MATTMTNELAIVRPENIQEIVSAAPQSYQDNMASRERCIAAGQELLAAIAEQGMTDELDSRAADFIERAKKTVRKMNERRSPVTKLFDDIRKEFTAMENAIDPTKADTVPYLLQQYRNRYAAKKRAEEEERRRQELARQQAEAARRQLRQDIGDDFNRQFSALLNGAVNHLASLDGGLTLDNYEYTLSEVRNLSTELPGTFLSGLRTSIRIPADIGVDEVRQAEAEVKARLEVKFREMYSSEVQDNKDFILDRLPSKKANLERIAQSNAEEAARMKAEMEERARRDAEAKEAERLRREAEEREKAELAGRKAEMENLFGAQAAVQEYQPKVKVKKKIRLLNPDGMMAVLSAWWAREGHGLTVDELAKMFRKQLTFCENMANREGVLIEDESVEYIDEVTAK